MRNKGNYDKVARKNEKAKEEGEREGKGGEGEREREKRELGGVRKC